MNILSKLGGLISVAPDDDTSSQLKYRLWISGYLTRELTSRELWAVAMLKPVLLLQAILGFMGGWILGMDRPIIESIPLSISSALVPVAMTLVHIAFMDTWVRVRFFLWGRRTQQSAILITSVFTVAAFWSLIAFRHLILYRFVDGFMDSEAIIIRTMILSVVIRELVMILIFGFLFDALLGRQKPHSAGNSVAENEDVPPHTNTEVPDATEMPEMVRIAGKMIPVDQIVFLHAQGNYLRIALRDEVRVERFRISEAIARLGEGRGLSPNRSYWVAFSAIKSLSVNGRKVTILMSDGTEVPVAEKRRKDVRDRLMAMSISVTDATSRGPEET